MERIGDKRRDTPITELGFASVGIGAAMGFAAGDRIYDVEFSISRPTR